MAANELSLQTTPEGLRPSLLPPPALQELSPALVPVGKALRARAGEVLRETVTRTHETDGVLDPGLQESFERICTSSTLAVALWIAGDGRDAASTAGRETWEIFAELAAHRTAPLSLVTRRCFQWRNVMAEVIQEIGAEQGTPDEAMEQALNMLQLSLEFSLLRMCECFDVERTRTDEQVAFMATHDALTGLPNRTLMLDRLQQMLIRCARTKVPAATLFIDLDNFKGINDTLGHGVGDELLQAVAARLDGVVRGADALGRLGGDEFVVISDEVSVDAGPELLAQRVLDALGEPFALGSNGETTFRVNASIGIATGNTSSAEELLRQADIAMYRAKWDGKNRYARFEIGMQDSIRKRLELETDLRDALRQNEFFLAYQPIVALTDLRPTGVEALIRWRHPSRGILQPDEFIPVAEETGLIVEIGKWVLDQACAQCAAWRAAGHDIDVAVNVSARQLDTDIIIGEIRGALTSSGLDAAALTIELTETTLMRDVEQTARRLDAIKALGVQIAIDDFGTGYSSMGHLRRFPIDALKIDRSFIAELSSNPQGETIVQTLVALGKALVLGTLAEGVEYEQELALLRGQDCGTGQGFLFARPMDAEAIGVFLREWAKTGAVPLP
jgi:diguanylate cyclase (GGDEF)-like protein